MAEAHMSRACVGQELVLGALGLIVGGPHVCLCVSVDDHDCGQMAMSVYMCM